MSLVAAAMSLSPGCSAAPTSSPCLVIYRGPVQLDPARPWVKVLRCGALETIICRSPRPLPNPECTP